jgi:hypothetical protein
VVGYDKQEQRSLAASLHNQVFDYGRMITNMLVAAQDYLSRNFVPVAVGVIAFVLVILLAFFGKGFFRWTRGGLVPASADGRASTSVEFYERLMSAMEERGVARDQHLTPLEFADTVKSKEVLLVTRAYNRVRFGKERLSATETKDVERALVVLEKVVTDKHG